MIAASDAGRAMRRSGWHSAVSSTLVSRSRAMPVGGPHRENWPALQSPRFFAVGDARSRCAARSGAGFRAPARCRSETGAPLFRGWRYAISRRVAQRCRVSRSRAMPVGDPHRENWPALQSPCLFAVGDARSRCASSSGAGFRAPARCRSEAPTGRTGQRSKPSPRLFAVGDARSRCASRSGAGFRAPARCRSETGAPLFRGWRYAISRRVAQRCPVSRFRAMPVGDRRSAFSWLAIRDLAARRASALVSRCRAMPVGDRRSFAVGDAPSGQLGSPGARGIRKKPS